MESTKFLYKKLLNLKNTIITGCEFYTDSDIINHIRIKARPNKWHENECPPTVKSAAPDIILAERSLMYGEYLTGCYPCRDRILDASH